MLIVRIAFPPEKSFAPTLIPSAPGTATGTITVSNGFAPAGSQYFSIAVGTSAVAPVIVGPPPMGGTVGVPYRYVYQATGTAQISFLLVAGTLPPGLQLPPSGLFSGTPSASGTYSGTVAACNGTTPNSTQQFTIVIADGGSSGSGGVDQTSAAGATSGSRCGSGSKFAVLCLGGLAMFWRRRSALLC